jgi:hypothetical protein
VEVWPLLLTLLIVVVCPLIVTLEVDVAWLSVLPLASSVPADWLEELLILTLVELELSLVADVPGSEVGAGVAVFILGTFEAGGLVGDVEP